jgi:hypothetical protein
MQQHPVRLVVASFACLLAACTSPWGGDVGCLTLASYPERIECQTKTQRTISGDEALRRKTSAPIESSAKNTDAPDPLCYTKAGAGEKPCTK